VGQGFFMGGDAGAKTVFWIGSCLNTSFKPRLFNLSMITRDGFLPPKREAFSSG
jgi:hypothetical protein